MERKLKFREKYQIFVKANKKKTDRHIWIALVVTLFAMAFFYYV